MRYSMISQHCSMMQRLQPVLERCILISFDHTALQALRARQPRCRLGWVVKRLDTAEFERASSLRPDLIIASTKLLRPDRPPWPGPWQWAVYSINDAALARAYADAGILLVETDDAERMAQVLAG